MQDEFERQRPRCFALAYRMLGSAADAEDVVQEAWLRWQRAPAIHAPEAWLRRTVSRLCIDHLRSARVRREQYVGPWLPEPIDTAAAGEPVDAESVSTAFLLLLERLTPAERAVYLLRQVFDVEHAEIAVVLGKSEEAVRQLFRRARRHVATERPRFAPSRAVHRHLLEGFVSAVRSGDLATLEALLAEDVRSWNDGGGRARAALQVVAGRNAVARLYVGLARKGGIEGLVPEFRELNGWPALVFHRGDTVAFALSIETDGRTIHAVHTVLNPDKLRHLYHPPPP